MSTNTDDDNFHMNDRFRNQIIQQMEAKAQRDEDRIQRQHEIEIEQICQQRMENTMMMTMNPMVMAQLGTNNNMNPMMDTNLMINVNQMMIDQFEVNQEENNYNDDAEYICNSNKKGDMFNVKK